MAASKPEVPIPQLVDIRQGRHEISTTMPMSSRPSNPRQFCLGHDHGVVKTASPTSLVP